MTPEQSNQGNGVPTRELDVERQMDQKIQEASQKTEAEKRTVAEGVRERLDEATGRAEKVKMENIQYGRTRDDHEVQIVALAVKEALSAVKHGIIEPRPEIKIVLTNLASKKLSPGIAAQLHPLIKKYLDPNTSDIVLSGGNQVESDFESEIRSLREQDPIAGDILLEAVENYAQQKGRDPTEIRNKFIIESKGASQYQYTKKLQDISEELKRKWEDIEKKLEGLPDQNRRSTLTKELYDALATGNDKKLKEQMTEIGLPVSDTEISRMIALEKTLISDETPQQREENNNELIKMGIKPATLDLLNGNHVNKYFTEYFKLNPETNKFEMQPIFKETIVRAMYESVNGLLTKASSMPDADWERVYNQFYEGRWERVIANRIGTLVSNDPRLESKLSAAGGDLHRDVLTFLTSIQREMFGEIDLREAYHGVRNFMNNGQGDPEKVGQFVKRFPASKVSQIMQGYNGFLFELAQSEFERDLQNRIVMSGNTIPVDLFAGYFDKERRGGSADYDRLKRNLSARAKALQSKADTVHEGVKGDRTKITDPKSTYIRDLLTHEIQAIQNDNHLQDDEKTLFINSLVKEKTAEYLRLFDARDELHAVQKAENDWMINRVLILAPGASLLHTLRAHEIMGMGNIRKDFKGIYAFSQYFNIRNKWKMGRGGEGQYAGGFLLGELFNLKIEMKADKSFFERISKSWIPKKLYDSFNKDKDKATDIVEFLDREILDKPDPTSGLRFGEVLQNFSIFGFFGRGGWRFAAFEDWFTKEFGQSLDSNWRLSYDLMQKYVGAGSRWFFDEKRATSEIQDQFFIAKYGKDYKSKMSAYDISNIFEWYTRGAGNEQESNSFKLHITEDGKPVSMTINEFIEEKTLTYRGRNFLALLERSPYDFISNISQLEPELIKAEIAVKKTDKSTVKLTPFEYYFTDISGLDEAGVRAKEQFLSRLQGRWGEDNIKHLGKIAQTYHRIIREAKDKDGKPLGLDKDGKTISFDKAYQVMANATEKVKWAHQEAMTATDIDNADLAKIFLGEDGLVTYMKNLREHFADEAGQEAEIGMNGFFRQAAHLWFDLDHPNLSPNTNDMVQLPFFKAMGEQSGEETYSRLWGDVAGWNKTVDQIMNLDTILMEMSKSKKLDKIMELHSAIFQLKGFLGKEKAQRLNYILAQATVRYFQQHTLGRLPFPFNYLGETQSKEISLSVLHGDRTSWSWKEEEVRTYLYAMKMDQFISKEMMEKLEKIVGSDTEKYILLQAGPSIVIISLLVLAASLGKKTMEEASPPKK